MVKELLVSEIFGPTFQGEGPSLGRRTAFLRLLTCNLECVWCDTKYTWDWKNFDIKKETMPLKSGEIVEVIEMMKTDHLVITGGEPMIQQAKLPPLFDELLQIRDYTFEIETAGTLAPTIDMQHPRFVIQWNVSPKLAHSGNSEEKRFVPKVLEVFNNLGANFKFVVQQESDLEEVAWIVTQVGIPNSKVYIMPEGTKVRMINYRAEIIANKVLEYGWNFTTRLHVLLWGDRRGV
jgi:organic radical activating enzyme